jgi:hypothetical protein
MATITAKFIQIAQTPGAVKYAEVKPDGKEYYTAPNQPGCKIGTLYIRKTAFQESAIRPPNELTVTITIA